MGELANCFLTTYTLVGFNCAMLLPLENLDLQVLELLPVRENNTHTPGPMAYISRKLLLLKGAQSLVVQHKQTQGRRLQV